MKKGRETTGRGVSLHVDVSAAVNKRIQELKPWVKGFSDYIQALIQMDLQQGTLGPVGKSEERHLSPAASHQESASQFGLSRSTATPMQCNEHALRVLPDCSIVPRLTGGPIAAPSIASAAIPIAA